MDGEAELKSLANGSGFYASANAAPERRVEENHVHRSVEYVGGELLKIDYDRICSQRNPDHFSRAAHAVQSVDGVFKVIVAQTFNRLAKANRLLGGPDAIGIEAQGIVGKCRREGAIDLQLVIRGKDAGFQFMGMKTKFLFVGGRGFHHLIDGANFARAGLGIRVAEETVRCEGNAIAQAASENLGNGYAPRLAEQVETREFKRR